MKDSEFYLGDGAEPFVRTAGTLIGGDDKFRDGDLDRMLDVELFPLGISMEFFTAGEDVEYDVDDVDEEDILRHTKIRAVVKLSDTLPRINSHIQSHEEGTPELWDLTVTLYYHAPSHQKRILENALQKKL
ncbi:hypothetical protein HDV00_005070 [Rhizophlyctis rosea]|nr:hypothetical protein HDV00_005070 [Rhizophlyctis rosea]